MSIAQLKKLLDNKAVSYADCKEKQALVDLVREHEPRSANIAPPAATSETSTGDEKMERSDSLRSRQLFPSSSRIEQVADVLTNVLAEVSSVDDADRILCECFPEDGRIENVLELPADALQAVLKLAMARSMRSSTRSKAVRVVGDLLLRIEEQVFRENVVASEHDVIGTFVVSLADLHFVDALLQQLHEAPSADIGRSTLTTIAQYLSMPADPARLPAKSVLDIETCSLKVLTTESIGIIASWLTGPKSDADSASIATATLDYALEKAKMASGWGEDVELLRQLLQVLLDGFKANEKSRKFSVKALVKLVKLAVHPAELLNGSLCAQLAFVMKAGMQQIKSREPTEALVRVCSHRQELIDAFRSNLQSITELRSSAQDFPSLNDFVTTIDEAVEVVE